MPSQEVPMSRYLLKTPVSGVMSVVPHVTLLQARNFGCGAAIGSSPTPHVLGLRTILKLRRNLVLFLTLAP
jgi:hypothetical protein